ncbi:hypothetical protein AB0K09_06860 [Streptomyces sp. NPDC049577]|uniref:hypothetical protein n=1 Tax=Streptomyces sp. NPDC049577 TaxID=3155153 RepID=UPI00341FA9DC
MPHPVPRAGADLRLIRAAVFTAVCVALSAGGHVLASCAGVPLWTLVAGFTAVFAVAAPLAGRERSLPGIAAGLAAGQLGLHALFGLGQRSAELAGQQARSEGRLINFAGQLVCNQPRPLSPAQARQVVTDAGLGPAAQHAAGMTMPASGHPVALDHLFPASLPMLLGHLLAALGIGWLLRRGEAALWRLVRLSARGAAGFALIRALRSALALVRAWWHGDRPVAGAVVRRADAEDERPAREPALRDVVVRRGPPRLALAA